MAKRSTRSSPVITVVLIVVAVAAMAFVVVRQQAKDDGPSATASTADRDFASLLRESEGLTYHVTYDVAGDVVADGASLVVDVYRDGDRVRILQTARDGDRELVSSVHKTGDEARSCVRGNDGGWTCADVAPGSLPTLGDRVLARLERSSGLDRSTGQAGGRDTECFASGDVQACFDDRAVPVRFSSGDSAQIMAAVEFGPDSVTDDDFAEPK